MEEEEDDGGGSDPDNLRARFVSLLLSALSAASRAPPLTSPSLPPSCDGTFEATIGPLHLTVHDGSRDKTTALDPSCMPGSSPAGSAPAPVGYLSVLVHATSSPLHRSFSPHLSTFRSFRSLAVTLGRSWHSHIKPTAEDAVRAEGRLAALRTEGATGESLGMGEVEEDPETLDQHVRFEEAVVRPLLEGIFMEGEKTSRNGTRGAEATAE